MNSDTLRRLMKAAGLNPDTAEGRGAFARVLGVDSRSIRRWLAGRNISEHCVGLLHAYRPRDPVARVAVEKFWEEEKARQLAVAPTPENLKVLADSLAGGLADQLAPVLKVDADKLAPLLKVDAEALASRLEKLDAEALARNVAGLLLPELRHAVEEAARKLSATRDGQQEAIEKVLVACVERVALLLMRSPGEVAGAVVDKAQPRLDAVVAALERALDAVAAAFKHGLRGLVSRVDSQSRQDAQERARDRARWNAVGDEVREIHVKADELLGSVNRLQAEAVAHRRGTSRQSLMLMGLMVAGFAVVTVTIVVRTQPGAPPSGSSGATRGSGATEEAARSQWGRGWLQWIWGVPGEGQGIEAGTGERKGGIPMPHSPLPGQAVAPCRGSAKTLYGGCWFLSADTAPCPPDQFQEGQKCYVPIPAKPNGPVGQQPQPGQEAPTPDPAPMPGKEQ